MSTMLGSLLVFKFDLKIRDKMVFFISFATGILLTTAFLDVLPEALELNKNALFYALISILALYILEQRIAIHTCHDEECETHYSKETISIFGLGLHSLLDGLVIGAGFSASFSLGLLASLGVIFHKIPEGISIYSIFTHIGNDTKKAIKYAFLIAVITPLGAVLSLIFLRELNPSYIGIALAFAAGSLIYIGATDLIPETHEKFHKLNSIFVLLGVGIIYLITKITGI
ncbi:MAG: ZIP family metal transporter [Patescibacteria group bacterium]|nr:ZIP family metal transporter [Patescibacteria group bacterium]